MYTNRLLFTFITLFYSSIMVCSQPNILLFGKPASGKGTFAGLFVKQGYEHFSLGDQIKQHVKKNTAYGQKFAPILKRANEQRIIPIDAFIDEARDLVFGLMADYVSLCKQENKPFILDGPIRSPEDVSYLLNLLQKQHITDLVIVNLKIDSSMLMERVAARRVCSHCYEIYNMLTKPSIQSNLCDVCQYELIQRPEDSSDLYGNRLVYYENVIAPAISTLIETCTSQQIPVHTFDVNRPIEECLTLYRTLLSK